MLAGDQVSLLLARIMHVAEAMGLSMHTILALRMLGIGCACFVH